MSGIFLAILSAAIFGFQNAAARRAVVTATPLQGMIITVPTVVPLVAVICYFLGGFQAIQNWSYVTYLLAGAAGVMQHGGLAKRARPQGQRTQLLPMQFVAMGHPIVEQNLGAMCWKAEPAER